MKKAIVVTLSAIFMMTIINAIYLIFINAHIKKLFEKHPTKEIQIQEENSEIKQFLFKEYYTQAKQVVNKMTLQEKVGQLFLVRYNKNNTNDYNNYYPGGYILFAKDFENHTKETIKLELDNLQKSSRYPLIIAVDEEGGYVTRISRYKNFRDENFSSPRYYYDKGGYDLLKQTETEKILLLKSLGINLNLAPVADVSTNQNDFIYNRAFGYDAIKTQEFIKNMVSYYNENNMNSCLKHFPGYGNNADTHTGIAIDERDYETFLNNDFLPFKSGIEENVPAILVSHNIIKTIDDKYPASLSYNVINELRNTLNFSGIIMTDDLAMDAVKSYTEDGNAATLAILAGNDLIITSDFLKMHEEIINAVSNQIIPEETIDTAVLRIIAWKYYSNLF